MRVIHQQKLVENFPNLGWAGLEISRSLVLTIRNNLLIVNLLLNILISPAAESVLNRVSLCLDRVAQSSRGACEARYTVCLDLVIAWPSGVWARVKLDTLCVWTWLSPGPVEYGCV